MNKIPRFMREYAYYIEKKYFDGFAADIENMLARYMLGHCTAVEVMSKLATIDKAWGEAREEQSNEI